MQGSVNAVLVVRLGRATAFGDTAHMHLDACVADGARLGPAPGGTAGVAGGEGPRRLLTWHHPCTTRQNEAPDRPGASFL